jgi:hypothetical protein
MRATSRVKGLAKRAKRNRDVILGNRLGEGKRLTPRGEVHYPKT